MLFGTWLRSIRTQERDTGVDFNQLACYGSKLTPYIQDHMAVALKDIEMMYNQLPSTALSEEEQRERWEGLRTEYIARMRAALDHFGAALAAVGCTEEELGQIDGPERHEEKTEDSPEVTAPSPVDETLRLAVVGAGVDEGQDSEKEA